MSLSPTPFDDVYKTLCTDCPRLLLPLLNETFGTSYTGSEFIRYEETELRFQNPDGPQHKRIADTAFTVTKGNTTHRYLYECESNPDSSILLRFFEYAILSGIHTHSIRNYHLHISLPHMAVLFLRDGPSMPEQMSVSIDQIPIMNIPVLKISRYTIDQLFDKKLYILIPFSPFLFERKFDKIEANEAQLRDFMQQLTHLRNRLATLPSDQILGNEKAFYSQTLFRMTAVVLEALTKKHCVIQKGVSTIMGGNLIDYPEARAYYSGVEAGKKQEQEKNARERQQTEARIAELEAKLREHNIEF